MSRHDHRSPPSAGNRVVGPGAPKSRLIVKLIVFGLDPCGGPGDLMQRNMLDRTKPSGTAYPRSPDVKISGVWTNRIY
jgi:hypothetical protein